MSAEPAREMQTTLAIIKPDAADKEDDIIWRITLEGFSIKNAGDFYAEHAGKPFYDGLIDFMTSGPAVALALQKMDSIAEWRKLIGPTNTLKAKETTPHSLRAVYGTDGTRNAFHGSDSPTSAAREVAFFFPGELPSALPDNTTSRALLEQQIYPILTKGLTQLAKEKPADPTRWLGIWLHKNNPNQPIVEEPPQ